MKKVIQYIIFAIVNLMFLSFLFIPFINQNSIFKPKSIEKYELFMDEFISILQGDDFELIKSKLSSNILAQDNYEEDIKSLKELINNKVLLKKDLINYSFSKSHNIVNKKSSNNFEANYELKFKDNYATLAYGINIESDNYLINAFHLSFSNESKSEKNKLTFSNLDSTDISFIIITIFIILFTLIVFNFYFFKEEKRKIRWLLFIAFGIITFTLNLNTNILNLNFFSAQILGGGYNLDPIQNQINLSFSIPIGAILYLIFRNRKTSTQDEPLVEENQVIDTNEYE